MDPAYQVLWTIAEKECKRTSRKTIRTLQRRLEGMQSGGDTPLANIWDEVCVQVQGQESVFWDTYQDSILQVIREHLQRVDAEIKQAMWLQTQNGEEWESENESGGTIPYSEDDIAEHVLHQYVLSAAVNWTNARIEKYKEREFD